MSLAMDSSTREEITIFIRLLNEGTEVLRPTRALDLGGGLFKVLATSDYDATDEEWEFPPNSVVRAQRRSGASGEFFLAVR